jgi:metallophosphoesterase (TIGR00282 family)
MEFLCQQIGGLTDGLRPDFIIANGENVAEGRGITGVHADALFGMGVSVITGGNHIFDHEDGRAALKVNPNLLRPLNYPASAPGGGFTVVTDQDGTRLAVVSLQGRSFLPPIDCPFNALDDLLPRLENECDAVFVDFHAEATAEKQAFAHYFDGRVSAVVGTHTHVQTADERILPQGTGFITDAGMTGPFESVIGSDIKSAIKRFRTQIPVHTKPAGGECRLNGVFLVIDSQSRTCTRIERINLP